MSLNAGMIVIFFRKPKSGPAETGPAALVRPALPQRIVASLKELLLMLKESLLLVKS